MLELIYLVFAIDLLFMLTVNYFWFWIKLINSSKGYRWHFILHLWDFPNFRQVIADEKDPDKRKKYQTILLMCRICMLASVIFLVIGGVLVWISEAPTRGRY